MTLTLVAPVAPSTVLREPLNQDSPRDCPRCQVAMRREMGPNDDPDTAGRLAQEAWNVCLCCGTSWLVVDETPLDRDEVRRRIRIVRDHRKVCSPDCGPDEPCRASRPGIPAAQILRLVEEQQ